MASQELRAIGQELDQAGYFSASDLVDARKKALVEIAKREGQPAFKALLMEAYGRKCAVTGCDAEWALEAAHIIGYLDPKSNHASNGLLLRADIHTLFDRRLLAIDPDALLVALAPKLMSTTYRDLNGAKLRLPLQEGQRPSKKALAIRWEEFRSK